MTVVRDHLTERSSRLLTESTWLLIARADQYPLERKLKRKRAFWEGDISRKAIADRSPRRGEICVFLQVGGKRYRALYGFGKMENDYEKGKVSVRYSYGLKWPYIVQPDVQAFLANETFGDSTLKKRLTFQSGAQGVTFIPLTERDKVTLSEMLSLFNELGEERKSWISMSEPERTEVMARTKRRIGQEKVRKIAEENYPHGCAMCEPRITEPKLLVASHIKDWAKSNKKEKYDPTNVLRLCVLHDEAFWRGFIEVGKEYELLHSSKLVDPTLGIIGSLTRKVLSGWIDSPPSEKHLEWHRRQHQNLEPFNSFVSTHNMEGS